MLFVLILAAPRADQHRSAATSSRAFNGISVWWHVIGVAVIIGVLIFVPDDHASADFVFTERINNSGFNDGAIGGACSGSTSCRSASC